MRITALRSTSPIGLRPGFLFSGTSLQDKKASREHNFQELGKMKWYNIIKLIPLDQKL